jgi:chromosome partitioning protein
MLRFKGSAGLRKIVVLNPKGGSGKTTLAFNLAGYIASTGRKVALVDMDRQGSSTRWLQNRKVALPRIHGISAINSAPDSIGDQCIVVPDDINYAVIDAPGGLAGRQLIDYTCGAHAILVPVLPSDLDIHAAARLVSDLLLVAQLSRRKGRLGVVANRVNERTVAYQQLTSFLNRLSIAVVGTLRDTQNYVWAASSGLSIHEMQPNRVGKDLAQWQTVTHWLERCLAMPLTSRDLLRPAESETRKKRSRLRTSILIPAAAAMALFVVSLWEWMVPRDANINVPLEPTVATENLLTAQPEPAEVVLPDETVMVDPSEKLRQKWQLSGIAKIGGASVMILSDRYDKTIRRISAKDDLNGWTVTDIGSNYAIFAQNGEEVRLVLNEEAVR